MTTGLPTAVERQRRLLEGLGLAEFANTGRTHRAAAASAEIGNAAGQVAVESVAPVAPPPVACPQVEKPSLASLEDLQAAVRACRACGLCATRKQAVPGLGHARAHWMVVGEGPGEQEDALGEPFVGPSGQLLDAMLAALGLSRQEGSAAQQVYIANAVKCRPPGNRTPTSEELAACRPYLLQQLALVRPRMVLALGRVAAQSLLGSDAPIGRLRGTVHRLDDGTPVVVSYHPAYLLRQPLEKARAWEDYCLAAAHLEHLEHP